MINIWSPMAIICQQFRMQAYKLGFQISKQAQLQMRLSENQLKETLKILVYEFINSVEKMFALSNQNLLLSKQELYIRIVSLLQVQKKTNMLDDCAKLLENSFEQRQKRRCFEKDFSFQSSVNNNEHCKLQQSLDAFGSKLNSSSEDMSIRKVKQQMINQQRASEITKYNIDGHQLFGFMASQKMDDNPEKHHQNDHEERAGNIEFFQPPKQENQINRHMDSDDDDISEDDSSETSNSESENQPNNSTSQLGQPGSDAPKSKTGTRKKKYRSYTDMERYQAVKQAFQYGIEHTSRYLNIPKKNITRWMKRKENSEKIRGRKPGNPYMEKNLTSWIRSNMDSGKYLTQTQIRNKAKEFSMSRDFKASKGWLEKYFRRNRDISEGLASLLVNKRTVPIVVPKKQVVNVLIGQPSSEDSRIQGSLLGLSSIFGFNLREHQPTVLSGMRKTSVDKEMMDPSENL